MEQSHNNESVLPTPSCSDATTSFPPSDFSHQVTNFNASPTTTGYPRDASLGELFELEVLGRPEAVAVEWEGGSLTYGELNGRANRVARRLREVGVGLETLVGVHVERSVAYVVSVLGVLKAGGAYVPLEPDYPAARLGFMVADAGLRVVITDRPWPVGLARPGLTVVDLIKDAPLIAACAADNPAPVSTGESLAYVIYTSGSTGQPKGVAIPQRGVVRLVRGQSYADFGAGQRFLLLAATSFDASTFELWGPLLNGGVCVIFPPQPLDFQQLETVIRRHGITCLWLTAGLFNQLLDDRPSVLATVRHVLAGGEALSVRHVRQALALGLRVTNGYGPTECTTFACTYALEPGMTFPQGTVPIGRPIAHTRCHVLDQRLQPVPVGVAGELYLGGDGLARGYLNQPALTAEKFIADPFTAGGRLYQTGDLARYRADGNLEFLGRRDSQVKLRGFRIELGEIEAVLATHPNLRNAAVLVREDRPGEKTLAAYLVLRATPAPTATELRAFLARQLPDYMLPAAFIHLDQLPLTPNGKLDRRALPAPGQNRLAQGIEFVPPRSPTEAKLAHIWQDLLARNPIGIHENFFALGGHSLLAVRVVFRIRSALNVKLPVMAIFEFPTIAELSRAVDETGITVESNSLLRPVRWEASNPLSPRKCLASHSQEQLWFLDQLEPGSSVYNVPLAIRLRGRLNQPMLQQSLNYLVQRHEALRTTFPGENGVPVQVVAPQLTIKLSLTNLENIPEAGRETEAFRLIHEAAVRPFDLSRGPLLRAELFGLDEENHILLLTIHHIVFDGWSVDVILRDLTASYTAFCYGGTPELPALPIQYADFATWQRQYLTAERVEQHLDYWRQQLAGVPTLLELPTDRPSEIVRKNNGAEEFFKLSPETASAIRQLGQQQDTTLFVTVLAAFQTLLHRYSRQEQILVGTPFNGRTISEVEDLIGFFVNSLPVKADFSGDPNFVELLRQVRDTVRAVQTHQNLPFERLVQELQPARESNRNPLFQACVIVEVAPLESCQMPGLTIELNELNPPEAMFDLTLLVKDNGGELNCVLRYNADLFNDSTAKQLLGSYQTLLAGILANPQEKVSEIPLVSEAELQRVLVNFNASPTTTGYPRDASLGELFELEVLGRPEAVAVEWEGGSLTYGELNGRANRVARRLREVGVGLETLVGVHVERSVAYVVSVLGVLKAGGAYVPLEPDYPAARLGFMVADAGLRVVITDRPWPVGLARPGLTVVDLIKDAPLIAACAADNPAPVSTGESLAYVIYTSGSTGQPKGVAIPQRGVVRLVRGQSYADFGAGQRFLLLAATSFDASTFELWGPLLNGGVCVIFPPQPLDFQQLETVIRRHGITCLWLTAGLFNQLLDDRPSVLATVRHVLAGGEALSVRHVRQALALGLRVTNGYGPTECTTFACTYALEPGMTFPQGTVPIGRPIAHTRCHVLDQRLQPVPVGVAGELYLGGDGLARGYLNQPALTAEKFIADPFTAGGRLYQTGDLARYRADGNLEFLGRRDSQVKLRGFRIELGEIEAVLATHPNLRNAAVLVREDRPGEKTLAAYLVLRATPAPTATELRAFLARQLPDYMLPAAFIHLDQLPLTPNGKLDRRALPAPGQNRLAQGIEFVPPRSPTEAKLAHIWQDLLARNPIGIHENFFALGGHSLLAVRVVNEISKLFNYTLPIPTFFRNPTIEGIARIIEEETHNNQEPKLIPLQAGDPTCPIYFLDAGVGMCRLAELLADGSASFATSAPLPTKMFEAAKLEGTDGLPSLADLAAAHTALIKSHQSSGSCLLSGHSFGGLLAFEVAHQLQRQGIKVEMILLLDSWATIPPWWRKLTLLSFNRIQASIKFRAHHWWKKTRPEMMGNIFGRPAVSKSSPTVNPDVEEANQPTDEGAWKIYEKIYRHARDNYQLRPLDCRAVIFRAEASEMAIFYRTDGNLRWDGLFKRGIEVMETPGDHFTLLKEPHLLTLAEHFKKCLAQPR